MKHLAPINPSRIGNRYAAPPMRENSNDEKIAPTEPIKLWVGGETVAPVIATTFGSPGTNDSRLNKVSRLSAIKITPMTSRLIWEGGAGARRASPRLAELVTPMVANANTGGNPIQTMVRGIRPSLWVATTQPSGELHELLERQRFCSGRNGDAHVG